MLRSRVFVSNETQRRKDTLIDRGRRTFLKTASSFALFQGVCSFGSAEGRGLPTLGIPIIDSHIHLFDPTRPAGVPWPQRSDAVLYQPALPPRYKKLALPFGVVGAIAVECSPWIEDND